MTVTWAKHTGAILYVGDSTMLGQNGGTGGFRPGVGTALTAAGYSWRAVGSVNSTGLCFAFGGTSLNDFLHAGAHPLDTEIATVRPFVLVLGTVYNDWRAGDGVGGPVTQAAVKARMDALITEAVAAAPWLRIVIPRCLVSENGDAAAWPAGNYAAYAAASALWNSTTGPSVASGWSAAGTPTVFCDAYPSEPAKDDFVHPVDGATGYGRMEAAIAAGIEAVKPR